MCSVRATLTHTHTHIQRDKYAILCDHHQTRCRQKAKVAPASIALSSSNHEKVKCCTRYPFHYLQIIFIHFTFAICALFMHVHLVCFFLYVTIALVLLPLRFHQFFFLLYFTVCSHKEYLCASFILFVHYLIWGGKDTRLNSIEIIHEWNIEWNENHHEFICPSSGMKCDRWIDVFLNTIIWWWCHRQSPLGKKTKLMKKKKTNQNASNHRTYNF